MSGYGRYATLSEVGCDRNGRARPKPAAQSPKHPGARCRLFDTSEKHDQPARCSLRAPDHPLQESRDRCPCSGRSSFQSCRLPEPDGIFRRRKCRHRSEEHTSELQSRGHLVCRLLLEKKKNKSANKKK